MRLIPSTTDVCPTRDAAQEPSFLRKVYSESIVHHHPVEPIYLGYRFPPPGRGIRFQSVQQPSKRIMRREITLLRLHPRRFRRTAYLQRGNQKVDVIFVSYFKVDSYL